MVGPDAEATALVRHASRLFLAGAALTVPFMTVVLRKGYGLGAQAMAGGSFRAPLMTVAWPTGEFGGMGLEGAVNSATARSWRRSRTPRRERRSSTPWSRTRTHAGRRSTPQRISRSTTWSTRQQPEDLAAAVIINTGASPGEARKRGYVDAW